MKRFLSFILVAFFAVSIANAQFSVMLVDDDDYNDDESSTIETALANWGGTYTFVNIDASAVPTYSDMESYDMVIWFTSSDGVDLNLWDVTDTTGVGPGAVKFNSDLTQYVENGGVLWIDGLDFIYDIYGGATDDFNPGDFVYDKLGIDNYVGQSYVDDGETGVAQMDKSSSNTITTLDPIKWKWSSLWYADAFEITSDATALYEMGPAGYGLEGKVSALYKDNIITSTLRIASFGDGSALVQDDIDKMVSEMITAAEAGNFVVAVEQVENVNFKLYPNPVADYAIVNLTDFDNANQITVTDITGRVVYSKELTAGQQSVKINTSNFTNGLYNVSVLSDNNISTAKMSVVK